MRVLLGTVLVSTLVFHAFKDWQEHQFYAQEFHRSSQMVTALRSFFEREGVYPKNIAHLEIENAEFWSLQEEGRGKLFLEYRRGNKGQSFAVQISIEGPIMTADFCEWTDTKPRRLKIWRTKKHTLTPADDLVPERVYGQLKRRLKKGTLQDCQDALSYIVKKRSAEEAIDAQKIIVARFPNFPWAKIARGHIELSRQDKASHDEFRDLVKGQPEFYPDWFHAARLYLSPTEFQKFATKTLPKVPSETKSRCYRQVIRGAYQARDYRSAIKYCEQWNDGQCSEIHLASVLASRPLKEARKLYDRYSFFDEFRSFKSPLEQAVIDGDTTFVLPRSLTAAKPFFPELKEFLIFPDSN